MKKSEIKPFQLIISRLLLIVMVLIYSQPIKIWAETEKTDKIEIEKEQTDEKEKDGLHGMTIHFSKSEFRQLFFGQKTSIRYAKDVSTTIDALPLYLLYKQFKSFLG